MVKTTYIIQWLCGLAAVLCIGMAIWDMSHDEPGLAIVNFFLSIINATMFEVQKLVRKKLQEFP